MTNLTNEALPDYQLEIYAAMSPKNPREIDILTRYVIQMANELLSLRSQLAELGRQDPVAWVSERNLKALEKHQCSVHVKPNNCMVRPIALYARPVPQAVSPEPVGIVEDSDYQTASQITGAEPRRKAVKELYDGALVVGQKLYTAPPAAIQPDAMLCDFYEASNSPDLVRELVLHVEQLQESAKRDVKPWQDTFPETLLPAYIERIKKADDAVRANTAPDDYFSSLVSAARTRADKAIRKFPQPNYVLNKVAEENGEVIKAVIHYTEGREEWSSVEGEIIDNLAMLIRLVTEGDQVIGFTPPSSCRATRLQLPSNSKSAIDYKGIVERISEIVHGKVTDIDLLSVTVKSMAEKLMVNCQVIPDSSVPEALRIIGNNINTQDNRITDQPMFVVFQKREIIGSDEHSPSRIVWVWDGEEVSELRAKRLEALYHNGRDTLGFDRYAMQEIDEFVTACFTEQGCEDYLSLNGHNLRQPYIFACGSFRNNEYQTVRNWLSTSARQHKGE
ncbi:hypothetical protein [Pectobacterium sp. CHL-2024]|uniref:hypothetical protein n=1 Tax=Pectobacterium sp. CHL-2024 TaxID=3377079 RepID=UPI00382381AC